MARFRTFYENMWVRTKRKVDGACLKFKIDGFWDAEAFGNHPVTGEHVQFSTKDLCIIGDQEKVERNGCFFVIASKNSALQLIAKHH